MDVLLLLRDRILVLLSLKEKCSASPPLSVWCEKNKEEVEEGGNEGSAQSRWLPLSAIEAGAESGNCMCVDEEEQEEEEGVHKGWVRGKVGWIRE